LQIKKNVPTRRGNNCFLILKKHLKDGKLIIGACDMICCPHCGTLGPSQKFCFIATAVYGSLRWTGLSRPFFTFL